MTTPKETAALFALVSISLLVAYHIIGTSGPAESIGDRIERQCKEEFGLFEQAVMNCRLQITIRALEEGHKAKMDRASRGIN